MIPEHKKWQTLKSEPGEDLHIFKVRFDYLQNPRNGKTIRATVLETNDSANVVAFTESGHLLMIRQYRFGTGTYTLELPGGFIEKGEEQKVAVQRELQEETGYTTSDWEYLGGVQSNPVFMDSMVYHWVARNVKKTDVVNLDDGEDVELWELTPEDVAEKVRSGEIAHPHTISALVRVLKIW